MSLIRQTEEKNQVNATARLVLILYIVGVAITGSLFGLVVIFDHPDSPAELLGAEIRSGLHERARVAHAFNLVMVAVLAAVAWAGGELLSRPADRTRFGKLALHPLCWAAVLLVAGPLVGIAETIVIGEPTRGVDPRDGVAGIINALGVVAALWAGLGILRSGALSRRDER